MVQSEEGCSLAWKNPRKGEPLTDAQVRKLTGLCQMDIDIAAEQLEAEGMLRIDRTYTLAED